MILALDSSTSYAGAALYNENGIVAEFTWLSHRDQTTQLLPLIQKMFDVQKMTPANITGVAVALGPGSFNGLRVALSEAKGIALSLGVPIFGVSSLDILAAAHTYLSGNLCVLVEAGRGRFGVGFYKVRAGTWRQDGEYLNLDLAELIERLEGPTFIAGELKPAQRVELIEKLPKAIILPAAVSLRRPGLLAELAWHRLSLGEPGDDLANLQPIYLHQPVKP
ncbi:MAG: tRNA ((37)-N6)-threonylcarbamoyltransferase complex dimerization subunit type 1 TsaB [Chloroflexi bacterium]|jgi:tRNA threonylcarbamoyladenosine biosynthesis protein TsaB|nr:tRNA ((37)-N6)-threonylcarbamoyltransferase complex dimerization subunit type 1 TsaB [Chloroflexota bacterium]